MNFRAVFFAGGFVVVSFFGAPFQARAQNQPLPPPPVAAPRQTRAEEQIFTRRVPDPPTTLPPLTRQQRQQAYAKLLEAQRYLWAIRNRKSSRAEVYQRAKPAYEALYRAVEINPGFAEAYTAMSELALMVANDFAEVERLAKLAIRFDPNNYGAHQVLSQIYTLRSGLNDEKLNREFADKAVAEWQAIVRLDPRNAEAWAFLSEFYERTGETEKAFEALTKWSGAAALPPPSGGSFYRYLTGGGDASPEAANVRLARAYLHAGRAGEAVAVLSRIVTDEPENDAAVQSLQEALESANDKEASAAIESLKQAVYGAPGNAALAEILADAQVRGGKIEDAAKTIKDSAAKIVSTDKMQAAGLLVKLGGIYAEAGKTSDALIAYEQSLNLMQIGKQPLADDREKQFAGRVIPLIVAIHQREKRLDQAQAEIARLRALLGKDSLPADEQNIAFLRSSGNGEEALRAVRETRERFPGEVSLIRTEAAILTDLGRVDEAVGLLRSKIVNKTKEISVPQSLIADFLAHLTISDLYLRSGRGADAVVAARQALDLAQNDEMTRIALLTLATAQNASGNFRDAEVSLRDILKKEPENPTALNNLGYFLLERNERLTEALSLIRRAVSGEPTNPSFLDSLGWAYFKLNQLDEAEKYLTDAARRNPESAAIQEHLGDLYEKQGKIEQAKTAWQKALMLLKQPEEIAKIRAKLNKKY